MTDQAPALLLAVKERNYKKVVDVLSKEGLKKDDTWIDYQSLIHAVLSLNVNIINVLLKSGCRVKGPKTNNLCTPLYYAVKAMESDKNTALTIMEMLLKAGASITDKDKNEETPLVFAIKNKKSKAVKLMLSMYNVTNIDPSNNDEFVHFIIACMENQDKLVTSFILKGIKVNTILNDHTSAIAEWIGSTPLHLAVKKQATSVIKVLLSYEADYTCPDTNGQTPLHLAYHSHEEKKKNNDYSDNFGQIMDLLLSAHANNFLNPVDKQGLSHFHIACFRNNVSLVNNFLQHGVDVNKLCSTDSETIETPLNFAIKCKNPKLVQLLLDHGANVDAKGYQGSAPLHLAIHHENHEIAEMLLKFKANICISDDKGNTPIHAAFSKAFHIARHDKLPKIEKLLDVMLSIHDGKMENVANEDGLSIFHIACKAGNIGIVKKFLENQVDVNSQSLKNQCWSDKGYTALHHAASVLNKELIELLLEYKANVNAVDKNGAIPLEIVIESQPKENKLRDFIENKFSKKYDPQDYTEDDYSDRSMSEDEFTIHCVLCKSDGSCCSKKKKNVKSSIKRPLLDLEEENELINLIYQEFKHIEIIELLVKNNSNINGKNKRSNPLIFNALHTNIFNFIDLPSNRFSLLEKKKLDPRIPYILKKYYADNCMKIMKILFDNGADLNLQNKSGNSLLHELAEYMRIKESRGVLLELAGIIMDKGSNPYLLNNKGQLAVTHTIRYRYITFLECLLKHKFNPNCIDEKYGSPLHVAVYYSYNDQDDRTRHNDMIKMLLDNGADVNAIDSKGRTPIFRAYKFSPPTPMAPGQANPGKALDLLLQRNADVNALDNDGRTALFSACIHNNPQCVHLLLYEGVDVNVVDKYGLTVLEKLFNYHTPTNIRNKKFLWIVKILDLHLKKLQVLGYPVNRSNLLYCKRLKYAYAKGFYPQDLKDMFSDQVDIDLDLSAEDERLTASLKKELEEMKAVKINEFTTLYDILFKNLQQMTMYVNNEEFKKHLDSEVLEDEFPAFGFILLSKYNNSLIRYPILETARKSMNRFAERELPEFCLDSIFGYLTNKDLENLCVLFN